MHTLVSGMIRVFVVHGARSDYWRNVFPKITVADITSFSNKYQVRNGNVYWYQYVSHMRLHALDFARDVNLATYSINTGLP